MDAKKDGSKYKDFFYYGCKHRNMQRGHKCDYRKQIREELLDDVVKVVMPTAGPGVTAGTILTFARALGSRMKNVKRW